MARPKRSRARSSRGSQRSSVGPAANIPVSQAVNMAVREMEDQRDATINKLTHEAKKLQDTIRVLVSAVMKDIPADTLDRPFLEVLREAESTVEEPDKQSATSTGSGKSLTTTTTVATTGKKGSKTVRSKVRPSTQNTRLSRSTTRRERTPAISTSLPPKGIITPKFDTSECRRGRTPSLTRKARPGEMLVSLSGSPVRSENRLQDKTAAIITLGNGKLISIAPDTDMKQCKVGKDGLSKLQALQQTITQIMKNNRRN